VVLNPSDRSWYYQSCPEEILQFVDDDVVNRSIVAGGNLVDTIATVAKLSNYQKEKLATFLNSELPHFDSLGPYLSHSAYHQDRRCGTNKTVLSYNTSNSTSDSYGN
jgi:hypothetical protein